jgi:hypothetical protein
VRLDVREQGDQLGTGKLPLKRCGPLVGQFFVQGQAELNRLQVGKGMRCQHLPLEDRAIDLHLIEPTGMDRSMDQYDARIDLVQPPLGGFAARRRAVVHDPEQAFAGTIRCLRSTWYTSRPNGSMPVVGSHRPMTYPRRTSHAARYGSAPPRSYAFSMRADRPGAGGRAGWQRRRAWMLVFSSALRIWSLGPRGLPCQGPAYTSRIGPAFSATWGSRGKIQDLYRQGLMASVASIRHTVLRLMG